MGSAPAGLKDGGALCDLFLLRGLFLLCDGSEVSAAAEECSVGCDEDDWLATGSSAEQNKQIQST